MRKKTGMIHRDPIVSVIAEKREKNLAKVKELNSAFYNGVVNCIDTALKIIAKQKDAPMPVSGMILTDRGELLIQVIEEASENE